jgi:hypothetical protein
MHHGLTSGGKGRRVRWQLEGEGSRWRNERGPGSTAARGGGLREVVEEGSGGLRERAVMAPEKQRRRCVQDRRGGEGENFYTLL